MTRAIHSIIGDTARWVLVLWVASCSLTVPETGITRPVWYGEQLFDDDTLIMPAPGDDGLARFICAETWARARPDDREIAFQYMSGLVTHYVHHELLLEEHRGFRSVDGDTPSQFEVRLTADGLTNPLVALGHECGHVLEMALGVYDVNHTDPLVWGRDGGHENVENSIIGTVKQRIVDLRLGVTEAPGTR